MAARLGKGFRIGSDGKLHKAKPRLDASARIRQKKSKKVRVARKGDLRGGN